MSDTNDPDIILVTHQQTEERLERALLVAAIQEDEQAIREGRVRPAEDVFAKIKAKHGF
jgi:hypothetical protein